MSRGVRDRLVHGTWVQTFPTVRGSQGIQNPLLIDRSQLLESDFAVRIFKIIADIIGRVKCWLLILIPYRLHGLWRIVSRRLINRLGPLRQASNQLLPLFIPGCSWVFVHSVKKNHLRLYGVHELWKVLLQGTKILWIIRCILNSYLGHFQVPLIRQQGLCSSPLAHEVPVDRLVRLDQAVSLGRAIIPTLLFSHATLWGNVWFSRALVWAYGHSLDSTDLITANDVVNCSFSLRTSFGQSADQVFLDSRVPRVDLSALNGMPVLVSIEISPLG